MNFKILYSLKFFILFTFLLLSFPNIMVKSVYSSSGEESIVEEDSYGNTGCANRNLYSFIDPPNDEAYDDGCCCLKPGKTDVVCDFSSKGLLLKKFKSATFVPHLSHDRWNTGRFGTGRNRGTYTDLQLLGLYFFKIKTRDGKTLCEYPSDNQNALNACQNHFFGQPEGNLDAFKYTPSIVISITPSKHIPHDDNFKTAEIFINNDASFSSEESVFTVLRVCFETKSVMESNEDISKAADFKSLEDKIKSYETVSKVIKNMPHKFYQKRLGELLLKQELFNEQEGEGLQGILRSIKTARDEEVIPCNVPNGSGLRDYNEGVIGDCNVDTCEDSYTKSEDGKSCVPESG